MSGAVREARDAGGSSPFHGWNKMSPETSGRVIEVRNDRDLI